MRRKRIETFCDECHKIKVSGERAAVVSCETHQVDLCEFHMRKHFVRATCRLIPAGDNGSNEAAGSIDPDKAN